MAISCGINAVVEALKADAARVERVCVLRGSRNRRLQEIVRLSRAKQIPVSFEPKAWMDRRAEGRQHQGALCYVAEMPAVGIEEILDQTSAPGLLLVLDGIEDPQNVGAIIRSAEVAGAGGILLPRRRSASLSPAVIRASAGAACHTKIARVSNIAQTLEFLKTKGFWVIGLDSGAARPIWEIDFTVSIALVLGGEGAGLHRLVKEKCDSLASIPVRGKVGSYNASVSAGIALYEAVRQRGQRAR